MLEKYPLQPTRYDAIRFPEPGEFVAPHLWSKRGKKDDEFFQGIAVGKQPWTKTGLKNGKCEDGGMVAVAVLGDPNFNRLLLDLLRHVLCNNPEGSPMATMAGELALQTKTNLSTLPAKVVCLRCDTSYEDPRTHFPRGSASQWGTFRNKDAPAIVKFCNAACRKCVSGFVSQILSLRNAEFELPRSLEERFARRIQKSNYSNNLDFITETALDAAAIAADNLMDEFES